jgi:hypothetical protein
MLENKLLKARINEPEARLAKYENAHTPPSLRSGRNRKMDKNRKDQGKPGQKIGSRIIIEKMILITLTTYPLRTAGNLLLAASFGNARSEFPLRATEPHV